jgi:putative ABC transport system ATP-binding protein
MIKTQQLKKSYRSGNVETPVLRGIDLTVAKGEFVSIMGRSGAGKSTLLYQLSLLDHPTSGEVFLDGVMTSSLSSQARADIRLNMLGYVFQDYALIPELTAVENVMIPMLQRGTTMYDARLKARAALDAVNLAHREHSVPAKMSGGEQQRVSIARAIAHEPKILFADEPTANLDSETSRAVLDIFKTIHARGQTIVMVTHEEEYGRVADRVIRMHDGAIVT